MTYNELVKRLKRLGCYKTRFAAGSHQIWRNPDTQMQAPIPYHASKEIGTKLLHKILKELGISQEEWRKG